MYSFKHKVATRERFWISFGKYMYPIPAASGARVSWVNYPTGLKSVSFRMYFERTEAYIGIEVDFSREEMEHSQFRKFYQMKSLLESYLGEVWHWEEGAINFNGKPVSRIFKNLLGVDIMQENDWPAVISFLKPRIIALDAFWYDNRDFFIYP